VIVNILTLTYLVLEVIAIGAGTIVLFWLLNGELLNEWAVLFLKCSLAASLTGLLIPFKHFTLTQGVSMLSVYLAGVAVWAWHKFHLMGVWRSTFALSTTLILYLNIVVGITQVFKRISLFKSPILTWCEPRFIVTQSVVFVIFMVLGIVAVKRFRNKPTHPSRPLTNGVSNKHVL
jgi:hypothetical protein